MISSVANRSLYLVPQYLFTWHSKNRYWHFCHCHFSWKCQISSEVQSKGEEKEGKGEKKKEKTRKKKKNNDYIDCTLFIKEEILRRQPKPFVVCMIK